MQTKTQAVTKVLNRLRGALGTGETPNGSNHNFITEWYNKEVDKIGDGPWCEMTVTWSMWTGGAKELKRGRAYTPYATKDAQQKVNKSSWHWGTKGMKAGDAVYYDWNKGAKKNAAAVDHVGIVERINGDGTFHVLEGNTLTSKPDGGELARMHRDGRYVMGYVRFDWDQLVDDDPSPAPNPSPTQPAKPKELLVDGNLGEKTIRRWQEVMKTTVDGVIDEPKSELVLAVQRKLKMTVNHRQVLSGFGIKQDGVYRPTVANLQKYLKSPTDGVIDREKSQVIKALQRRLNENRF